MNSSNTDVGRIRRRRKWPLTSGNWLLVLTTLTLLALGASARPSDEQYDAGFGTDEYADVDNVEWHHVKIVDGVMQAEDHPVIFYKEDFVSEDYDPSKEKHKNATGAGGEPKTRPHHSRKYKEISRRHRLNRTEAEKYRALKPEKIYFDVLPQAPVVVADDDSGANDSKFDASKIRVEVMSLADDEAAADEVESKQVLSKRPKKYRRRQRRDTGVAASNAEGEERNHKKRNAYYVQDAVNPVLAFFQSIYGAHLQQATYKPNPVRGNYWNPLSLPGPQAVRPPPSTPASTQATPTDFVPRFGDENEQDRVVWGSKTLVTKRPITTKFPPLFRDPNPNNIDTSFLTSRPSTNQRPQATRRPLQTTTRRPLPPLFYDPDPENADLSFLTQSRPTTTTTARPPPPPTTAAPEEPEEVYASEVSDCVWAIVQCCSRRDRAIRYQCFESMRCYGAFWDLNPCAENIQDNAINYVNEFLN